MLNVTVNLAKVPAVHVERSPGYWQTVARRFLRDPAALVAGSIALSSYSLWRT